MEGLYNFDMCKLCGGKCCQREAGAYAPEDLQQPVDKEYILFLLQMNIVVIDWWIEGERNIYYLRPKHMKEVGYIASEDNSIEKGACNHWCEETGCMLPNELKPMQCRLLEPNYFHETNLELCAVPPELNADKRGMAFKWIAYQNILSILVKQYKN